jgi:hypothetical protein
MSMEPRPRTVKRPYKSLSALALSSVCMAIALSGCDAQDPQGAELQALLDDGELGTLMQSALTVTDKGTGGTSGTALPGPVGGSGSGSSQAGGGAGGPPGGTGGFFGTGGKFGGVGGGAGGDRGCSNAGAIGGSSMGADGGVFPPKGAASPDAGVPSSMAGGSFDVRPGSGGRGGAGGTSGGTSGSCFERPIGIWDFDDCSDFRTQLSDSSFNNNTAFRSIKATCTQGISGMGVSLPNPSDIVYVPDQPTFTFTEGVTVAAWIKPRKFNGVQTLFRKRDGATSSLALVLNGKQLQFVISRSGALPVSAEWKGIKEGAWTHVAARYDGQNLRLYVNGSVVVDKRAPGKMADGEGPLLMGNDGFSRRFDGVMDNFWFATSHASDDVIMGLTCIRAEPTLVATPAQGASVEAGKSFTFDLALTNKDSASCGPSSFLLFSDNFFTDMTFEPSISFLKLASGETQHIPVTATAQTEAESGDRLLSFSVQSNDRLNFNTVNADATIKVTEPTGCHVKTGRELMIKNVAVVDDPVRTTFNQPGDPRSGKWTFKHLMEQMAPTTAAAPDMVENMLKTWLTPQTINGFTIEARQEMQQTVLNRWPRLPNRKLDLSRPPLLLQAIVNRFDLRNLAQKNAGEGRFVFAFMGDNGFPLEFTLILEYKLPAKTLADVQKWADDWHALGALTFPSEEYNAALTEITERFVKRGAAPGRTNGSAINSVRTNEIALSFEWQLREFVLDATTGLLRPEPIKLTPDQSFDNSSELAEWINSNQTAILAETHEVPLSFQGKPFLGGAVFNNLGGWHAPGVDPETRHKFSLNTCNGCHSIEETNTSFLQIRPRFPGSEAGLSGFLTGTTVFDQNSATTRSFNDLSRRNKDLTNIVCPLPKSSNSRSNAPTLARQSSPEFVELLSRGISRVH